MKKLFWIFFFFFPSLLFGKALQQGEKEDSTSGSRRYLIETRYLSNTNYQGHFNDSVKQPSYSLKFKYYAKSGFRTSGTIYRVNNSDSLQKNATYEFDLSAEYSFKLSKKSKLNFTYSHYFFDKSTPTNLQ